MRSIVVAALGLLTVMIGPAATQDRIGPSFQCPTPNDALGQLVCEHPNLSRLDLIYVQAYQALRQQIGLMGERALRSEAAAFNAETRRRCGIPRAGSAAFSAPYQNAAPCVQKAYEEQHARLVAQLIGPAAEEAGRPIETHVALQDLLVRIGFLSQPVGPQGVYGPATRAAIVAWQNSKGRRPTGILGDADAAALQGAFGVEKGDAVARSAPRPDPKDETARAPGGSALTVSADTPWFFVSINEKTCTRVSNVFPKPGTNFPSTPEGIISAFQDAGGYTADHPAYGPAGDLHPPGPLVILKDILGHLPTLALVQGEQSCQEVLALMLRAGTEGSAEQRWAARNAERAAQWHVVAWGTERLPCILLSEMVIGATTPEEALTVIQQEDPDAFIDQVTRPDQWERIIRTEGHNLRMVRNEGYCAVWSAIMR